MFHLHIIFLLRISCLSDRYISMSGTYDDSFLERMVLSFS